MTDEIDPATLKAFKAQIEMNRLHNDLAPKLIAAINLPLQHGGTAVDVIILLETVLAGVLLLNVKPGGEERTLKELSKQVVTRMKSMRKQINAKPDVHQ